jgi:hypothetical protein
MCRSRRARGWRTQGYCCTPTPPARTIRSLPAIAHVRLQCRGANRESLNGAVICGQGGARDLINYCCSGTPQPAGCLSPIAWRSPPDRLDVPRRNLPKGEQQGQQSRADYYHLLCVPTPAPNQLTTTLLHTRRLCRLAAPAYKQPFGMPVGQVRFRSSRPDTERRRPPMQCPEPDFGQQRGGLLRQRSTAVTSNTISAPHDSIDAKRKNVASTHRKWSLSWEARGQCVPNKRRPRKRRQRMRLRQTPRRGSPSAADGRGRSGRQNGP